MKVVIDTSVLFQALYSSTGASHAILKMVRDGRLEMVISTSVFKEYCDVLLRPKNLKMFELSENDVCSILDFIALVSVKIDIDFLLRPNLQDENDNMFMELAFASDSRFLITKNIRDFVNNAELKFDGIQIITPADFMKMVNHR